MISKINILYLLSTREEGGLIEFTGEVCPLMEVET